MSGEKKNFADKFKTVLTLATLGALSMFAGDKALEHVAPDAHQAVHTGISKVGRGLKKTLASAEISMFNMEKEGNVEVGIGGGFLAAPLLIYNLFKKKDKDQ